MVLALGLTWKISYLATPDLVRNYPFMFPDSFDWISNSTYLLNLITGGMQIEAPTIRQPLFSIVLLLPLASDSPVIALAAIQLAALGIFFVSNSILSDLRVRPTTRFLVILILLFSHSFNSFRVYLMPDFIAIFLSLSAVRYYLLALANHSEFVRPLLIAATFSSLAGVTQFYGFFPSLVFSALICSQLISRKGKSTGVLALLLNISITASLQVIWMVFKLIHFGSVTATAVSHFELLAFEFTNLEFYLNVWGIFFLPLIFLILLSAPRVIKTKIEKPETGAILFLGSLNLLMMGFIFFYQWKEARFTTFFFPYAVILASFLLDRFTKDFKSKISLLLTGVLVSFVCLVPSDDLMRPTLRAQISNLSSPQSVINANYITSIFESQPVKRLRNSDCLVRDANGDFSAVKPTCDQYIWRNILKYLHFFKSRIEVFP